MPQPEPPRDRRSAVAVLARADAAVLAAAWDGLAEKPAVETLRRPEFGLVMARGRIGGGGSPFNLGEVTVTRAAVRLSPGVVGHGHVLGRDRRRAWLVACFDALWQTEKHRPLVEKTVLGPTLEHDRRDDDALRARTAATRVSFFTMVRGEDP